MASSENPESIEIGPCDEVADVKPCQTHRAAYVKPIRLVQLGLTVILLGLTTGLLQPPRETLDAGNIILLGIIHFSFVVVEIVDVLSQFGNDPIPDTPMFVFGSCGVILFLVASGGSLSVFARAPHESSTILVPLGVISFCTALVHLVDVILIYLFGCGANPEFAFPIVGTSDDPCTVPMAKPIRVFQCLLMTTLFALTMYTISKNSPYHQVESTLLMVVFGSFLFITLVDIISQFGGDPIPDTPMFLFGVVGTLLFVMSSVDIYFTAIKENIEELWRLTISIILCAASSFMFLLDVLLIFLYGY